MLTLQQLCKLAVSPDAFQVCTLNNLALMCCLNVKHEYTFSLFHKRSEGMTVVLWPRNAAFVLILSIDAELVRYFGFHICVIWNFITHH